MISRFCHYIWKRTTRTNTQSQRIIRMSLFDCPATQNKLCLGYFILDNFEIPLKGMAYFFFICFLCFYPPSLMTDSQNHLYCFNSWLFKIMSNCIRFVSIWHKIEVNSHNVYTAYRLLVQVFILNIEIFNFLIFCVLLVCNTLQLL